MTIQEIIEQFEELEKKFDILANDVRMADNVRDDLEKMAWEMRRKQSNLRELRYYIGA